MTLTLKILPRAKKTEFGEVMADGVQKVRVAAVPEDGKANEELRRVLANHYRVPLARVTIVAGAASTRKLVRIAMD